MGIREEALRIYTEQQKKEAEDAKESRLERIDREAGELLDRIKSILGKDAVVTMANSREICSVVNVTNDGNYTVPDGEVLSAVVEGIRLAAGWDGNLLILEWCPRCNVFWVDGGFESLEDLGEYLSRDKGPYNRHKCPGTYAQAEKFKCCPLRGGEWCGKEDCQWWTSNHCCIELIANALEAVVPA